MPMRPRLLRDYASAASPRTAPACLPPAAAGFIQVVFSEKILCQQNHGRARHAAAGLLWTRLPLLRLRRLAPHARGGKINVRRRNFAATGIRPRGDCEKNSPEFPSDLLAGCRVLLKIYE